MAARAQRLASALTTSRLQKSYLSITIRGDFVKSDALPEIGRHRSFAGACQQAVCLVSPWGSNGISAACQGVLSEGHREGRFGPEADLGARGRVEESLCSFRIRGIYRGEHLVWIGRVRGS